MTSCHHPTPRPDASVLTPNPGSFLSQKMDTVLEEVRQLRELLAVSVALQQNKDEQQCCRPASITKEEYKYSSRCSSPELIPPPVLTTHIPTPRPAPVKPPTPVSAPVAAPKTPIQPPTPALKTPIQPPTPVPAPLNADQDLALSPKHPPSLFDEEEEAPIA